MIAIERAIREGNVEEARRVLAALGARGRLGTFDAAKLANYFWRVGLPQGGLRVLVRRHRGLEDRTWVENPRAGAEFAACLLRLGAIVEAKRVLALEALQEVPETALYQAFAHIESWDYATAAKHLLRYVQHPEVDGYRELVGVANLAAALVYERDYRAARPMLRRLLNDRVVASNKFLLGFVLEAAAAETVLSGDYETARRFLDDAKARWSAAEPRELLYLKKWEAVLQLRQNPSAAAIAAVDAIRDEALSEGFWECARDCDRQVALATRDEERFRRVYFGTSHPEFRARLLQDFGVATTGDSYVWRLGNPAGAAREIRCLVDSRERAQLGLRGQNAALFSALAAERYRPPRLATLFSVLHPDERYSPTSTPKRMYESIRRLEEWFRAQKLPLRIVVEHSHYRLEATEPVDIHVPAPERSVESYGPLIARLRSKFGAQPFALRDTLKALEVPRRTLLRHLDTLTVTGKLRKSGRGRAARYQIAV